MVKKGIRKTHSSTNNADLTEYIHTEKQKLDLHFSSYTKSTKKGNNDLNGIPEIFKLLEVQISKALQDNRCSKEFLKRTP